MHQADLEKQVVFSESHGEEVPRWAITEKPRKPFSINININIGEKDVINFLCVLLNTISTVCIVFANKM